ncbi:MAG: hypothetical protein M3422_21025 [Actinomycetota bacterium]|nr:hypothetical protein [Actinomycetota bacterium]
MAALWDLRDAAYDEPAAWSAFTAEGFLQGLAAELEQALADDSGQVSTTVMARALAKALAPRPGGD